MSARHYRHGDGETICRRVPGVLANVTNAWAGVTCKWCLRLRPPDPCHCGREKIAAKWSFVLQFPNIMHWRHACGPNQRAPSAGDGGRDEA